MGGTLRRVGVFLLAITLTYMPVKGAYSPREQTEKEEMSSWRKAEVGSIVEGSEGLLARLIMAEAGSDECSDLLQLYVGSVVLNRVAHPDFPNTIQEVIYQEGQYYCVDSTAIRLPANDRAKEAAAFLMEHGSILPGNVLYQAEFKQGDGVFAIMGNQYFCIKGESWE